MDQLVAMGKQAKITMEDLKNGDVTLNDTIGLQNSIQGLQQQMKEDFKADLHLEGKRIEGSIENSINNAISLPPTKRQRRISPGRRLAAPDDIQTTVTDVEMVEDEAAGGLFDGPANPVPSAPAPASGTSRGKKLESPAMQRANDYNQDRRDSQTYADKAATKPTGGRQTGQQRKRAPRNQGRQRQSSGDRESDNNNGSSDDRNRDRSRSNNDDNGRNRDRSRSGYMKHYQVINDKIA